MSHNHSHSHTHTHAHNHSQSSYSNIAIAFTLNFVFSIIEIVGGILTNSTAILSDAVHDLGDSLALAMSYVTEKLSKNEATETYNYGYKRFSLIGAIINILVLSVGTAYVLREAIISFQHPEPVDANGMLWLAILGITVNGLAAFRMKGSKKVLDRTVVLHLLEDLMGWVAVLVVSVVIRYTSWYILDPILSMVIALIVIRNIWSNIIQVYRIIMQSVPDAELFNSIKMNLAGINGVIAVEDIKLWTLDGDDHVMTATIRSNDVGNNSSILHSAKDLADQNNIHFSTIEIINSSRE
ncbi:Cation transporter [Petrocella atlantisensis]|uniref:Cation transporter n=1 Tax=Petrocella atlantisensis TaxID=2173034 RepID=A0A3P7P2F6_9FIRM|nr:cation diffusion facilitator family transporter [Petrocella atlantisensis]VDN49265.1 Cation transporter [Petrocella atlantisensis]